MTAINDLEKKIKSLENNTEKLTKEVTQIHNFIDDESYPTEKLKEDIKKIEKTKAEITTYTIELISIIVGFLGVLLAIVVVGIDKMGINNDLMPIILYLGIVFIVFFAIFVIYWIKVNYCEKQK